MKVLGRILKYLIIFLLCFIVLLPFLWTLYAASVTNDLDLGSSLLKTDKYGIDNFIYILTKGDVWIWFKNSIFVVTVITALNLLINTMAGYALAQFRFKGRQIFFLYVTGIMMIPAQVLVIPIFLVSSNLGITNSYLGLILPFIYNPFGVFLMRQYFLSFPKEIVEAAEIDGLGVYSSFFHIVLPLAKNALMTQTILIFVWNWNSFMLPSTLVNDPALYTLPLGMYQITNTQYVTSVPKAMAGAALTLIPTIIFYLIFQKKLINSDMGTAVKG